LSVKRFWHATALGLIGWYLMVPPTGQQNGVPWPDNKAPISHWTIAESFDAAKDCEEAVAKHRKKFEQTYKKLKHKTSDADFWGPFYITTAGEATCIATNDPRLRDENGAKSPEVRPSATE